MSMNALDDTSVKSFYAFDKNLLNSSDKLTYINEKNGEFVSLPPEIEHNRLGSYTLCIRAPMASGKTTAIKTLFEGYNNNKLKVLFISPRITFAIFLYNTFKPMLPNLVLYNTVNSKSIHNNQVVVQLESLGRINADGNFDIIILDEFQSIMTQFFSPTVKNYDIEFSFLRFVQQCNVCVVADALLTPESVNRINAIRRQHHCYAIENDYVSKSFIGRQLRFCDSCPVKILKKYFNDTCDFDDHNHCRLHNNIISYLDSHFSATLGVDFVHQLITRLQSGKRCVVCSASKQFSIQLFNFVRCYTRNRKIMLINSDTTNIDYGSWSNYDCLIYTPKISIGIDFEREHYDTLFIYVIFSTQCPSISTMFQSAGRVRKFVSKSHYIYCNDYLGSKYININMSVRKPSDLVLDANRHLHERRNPYFNFFWFNHFFKKMLRETRFYFNSISAIWAIIEVAKLNGYKSYYKECEVKHRYHILKILENMNISRSVTNIILTHLQMEATKNLIRIQLNDVRALSKVCRSDIFLAKNSKYLNIIRYFILDKNSDKLKFNESLYYIIDISNSLTQDKLGKTYKYYECEQYRQYVDTVFKLMKFLGFSNFFDTKIRVTSSMVQHALEQNKQSIFYLIKSENMKARQSESVFACAKRLQKYGNNQSNPYISLFNIILSLVCTGIKMKIANVIKKKKANNHIPAIEYMLSGKRIFPLHLINMEKFILATHPK